MKRSRVMFRGKVFRVRRDVVVEPAPRGHRSQGPVVREVVEHKGSVVVLPLLGDGRVVLVRQYRYPADDFLWELVAGHIKPGERPSAAARRELEEESGYRARRLKRLTEFYPSPGFVSEKMTLYRATGLRAGRARPERDEALEARAFSRRELEGMLGGGKVRDAKTLVGLLLHWRRASR